MGCRHSSVGAFKLHRPEEDWVNLFKREDADAHGPTVGGGDPGGGDLQTFGKNAQSRQELLDDYEKELIRRSWSLLVVKSKTIGKQVFQQIFELRPSAKNLFPFRNVHGEKLLKHPLLSAHSKRFLKVIGCVVGKMDALEECRAPLMNLGTMHLKIKGFLPDYFDVFTRAIMHVWREELQEAYTDEMAVAWQKILDYIVARLKEGYDSKRVKAAYFVE